MKVGVPVARLSLKNMSSKFLIKNFASQCSKRKKKIECGIEKTCKAGELIADYLILTSRGE